jgi:hypothetical protein
MMQVIHEIKSRIAVAKQHSTRRIIFHQQIGLKYKEDPSKVPHCMPLKCGQFRK